MTCIVGKGACLYTHFDRLRKGIYEFFTQNNANLIKIEGLSQKFLSVQRKFHRGDVDLAMDKLHTLLLEDARFQICNTIRSAEAREAYKKFSDQLQRIQHIYANREKVDAWVQTSPHCDKELISRYLLAEPAHLRFSASFDTPVPPPYRFSEIPAGSILVDAPTAFLEHMRLENKRSILQMVYLKVKAFICRIFTGKYLTHMAFSMGDGRIFDLSKTPSAWIYGDGQVKEFGDKMYYGMVRTPNKERMLKAYNEHFPDAPCANFEELMEKMNARISCAAKARKIKYHFLNTIKTGFHKTRPVDYDYLGAWKNGAPRTSCSGTTSALLSSFGIDVGGEFNKMADKVTPADFLASEYFDDHYILPY